MPATIHPFAPHNEAAPPTHENLEYADLAVIDISKASSTPESRIALAEVVRNALSTTGFFYVVGHGYSQDQTDRIFDIADVPFTQVGDDEKKQYVGNIKETGTLQGYKLRRYWEIDNGVRDEIEIYAMNKNWNSHPRALRPFVPNIKEFARFNHEHILHEILRLLALGLELPEETLVNLHNFDAESDSYARFLKYYPRNEEDEEKSKNVWLKGHTDVGTVTILWSQPVAGLQIMSPDGKWRWVKHVPNALVINTGDTMEFLSGGFYKPTIHRVVQPPVDQRKYARLGVFYFAVTDDVVPLLPLSESPVLQRIGVKRQFRASEVPTMKQWRKARAVAYGTSKLTKEEDGNEVELFNGVEVKHYN